MSKLLDMANINILLSSLAFDEKVHTVIQHHLSEGMSVTDSVRSPVTRVNGINPVSASMKLAAEKESDRKLV